MEFVIWAGLFLMAWIFIFCLIWILERNYDRQYHRTLGYHNEWD